MAIDYNNRGLTDSDRRFISIASLWDLRNELAEAEVNRDRVYASALATEILAREREVGE